MCRYDHIGNLTIETPGNNSEWIETGSHVDTVADGGNYDGLAGVVAGFEVLHAAVNSNSVNKRGLRLRIWRGEESAAFGISSIGSRAAFGKLPCSALHHSYSGQSLSDAIKEQGFNPALIQDGIASITSSELNSMAAFIELHIEQGKVLESLGSDIGIVSSIRGSKRSWIDITGTFDHSGATPMGSTYRSDANLAMAHMLVELDQLLNRHNACGGDLVQTTGLINSDEHANGKLSSCAITKVSGTACFSLDVRGCHQEEVDLYCEQAFIQVQKIAKQFAVSANIETFSNQAGIMQLDQHIQKTAAACCETLKLNHLTLPSGAWHDAATVAAQVKSNGQTIPTGMIFIPCRAGVSHSPDEFSSAEQIAKGATLLAAVMMQLASK